MNKENAVAKIRTMGKVGYVIAWVLGVMELIGLLTLIVSLIVFAVLPEKLITFTFEGQGSIAVDLTGLPGNPKVMGVETETLDENELDSAFRKVKDSLKLDIGGMRLEMDDASVVPGGVLLNGHLQGGSYTLRDLKRVMFAPIVILLLALVTTVFAGLLCRSIRDCGSPFDEKVIRGIKALAFSLIPWVFMDWLQELVAFPYSTSHNFTIDLSMACVVLIILGLAYIFQYGAVLQQESDETL